MDKKIKVIIAQDSFKESMSAKDVCGAMQNGVARANPNINCISVPMADGGEGTVESLINATGGNLYKTKVKGPLDDEVEAEYGILGNGEIAVIEMSSASGIQLLSSEKRNPLKTSTYGTGQLIRKCLNHSVKKILIGIGGSATNDGGAGMLQALGVEFLDEFGMSIQMDGGKLGKIVSINTENLDSRLKDVVIEVACDVNNILVGENGASYVFGPQKGATKEMVRTLDDNLCHYGEKIKEYIGVDVFDIPGSGASGGLGAGLLAFLDAKLRNGIDMVIEYTKLEDIIKSADLVITGEGSIDNQTVFGKTPFGISRVAKKHNVPVIAIAGKVGDGIEALYENGTSAVFSIIQGVTTLEDALSNAKENIEKTTENIIRLYCLSNMN